MKPNETTPETNEHLDQLNETQLRSELRDAQARLAKVKTAFDGLMKHYADESLHPRPNDNAIAAMKDVAMAAIALAASIVEGGKP